MKDFSFRKNGNSEFIHPVLPLRISEKRYVWFVVLGLPPSSAPALTACRHSFSGGTSFGVSVNPS
jgi:hypothetical protein